MKKIRLNRISSSSGNFAHKTLPLSYLSSYLTFLTSSPPTVTFIHAFILSLILRRFTCISLLNSLTRHSSIFFLRYIPSFYSHYLFILFFRVILPFHIYFFVIHLYSCLFSPFHHSSFLLFILVYFYPYLFFCIRYTHLPSLLTPLALSLLLHHFS